MKIEFYTTKRYTYIVAGNVTFKKKEQGYPQVNEVPYEKVEEQNFTEKPYFLTFIDVDGEITNENLNEAYTKFCNFCKRKHEAKKIQNEKEEQDLEADFRTLENEIKEGKVFKANVDNLRRILKYLNSMNWGVWRLPNMSVGYSAHQYDYNGRNVTTISLDEPINYYGEMVSKFKVGGSRNFLPKYCFIR
jgi:hypothetical protein